MAFFWGGHWLLLFAWMRKLLGIVVQLIRHVYAPEYKAYSSLEHANRTTIDYNFKRRHIDAKMKLISKSLVIVIEFANSVCNTDEKAHMV